MALVAAAIALAVAAVTGALLTGASVRQSLFDMMERRLGQVHSTLAMPQGTFRQTLLQDDPRTAPMLRLQAYAATSEASSRLWLQGVNQAFFSLAPAPQAKAGIRPGELWLNAAAAASLKVKAGESIVLRLKRPSALSGDFMLASPNRDRVALRLKVAGILPAAAFGDFSLESNQRPSPSAFADLDWLATELGIPGRANLLISSEPEAGQLSNRVRESLRLEDLGCSLTSFPEAGDLAMVRSSSGFLPEPVLGAAAETKGCRPVFTWFANAIAAHGRETPFSFVCGDDSMVADQEDGHLLAASAWLAEDLGLHPGDDVTLRYFTLGTGPDLVEKSARLKVGAVLPPTSPAAKGFAQALMPDFPGLAGAENCSDWDAELPIDLKKVRKKDEAYWDNWRGAPKAFVSLRTAQALWNSRLGRATAVVLPPHQIEGFLASLRQQLTSAATLPGMQIASVRQLAAGDAADSVDFAGLFLGLSFFFIVAALILAGLALGFFLESRQAEVGTLRAIGLPDAWIHRLFLFETSLITLPGVLLGLLAGIGWCQIILWNLNSLWIGAVGTSGLTLHLPLADLALAGGIGLLLSLGLTTWMTRRFSRQSIRSLADEIPPPDSPQRQLLRRWVAGLLMLAGAAGAFLVPLEGDDAMGGFIGCGCVLLVGSFGLLDSWIRQRPRSLAAADLSLPALAWRNLQRRGRRSLAVSCLLGLGLFLTVAVGVNQKGTTRGPANRHSGTGGFSLYLETALPMHQDLNQAAIRQKLGLPESSFVPFRLAAGSSADCQNLNHVSVPQIIACPPRALASRQAFVFKSHLPCTEASPWALLDTTEGDTIPVIADMNSLAWILKKKVGETLEYQSPAGSFKLKVVGGLENSVLQGSLIMSEQSFLKLFPKADGYQLFLAETAPGQEPALAESLLRSLGTEGASLETTAHRLNQISLVQNTYLKIFLALGGLGVLLGLLGASLLLRRNLHERRRELAWMMAAGFGRQAVSRLLLLESLFLMLGGIFAGTLAAAIVLIPLLRSASGEIPWGGLGVFYLVLCLAIVLFNLLVSLHALRQTPPAILTEE